MSVKVMKNGEWVASDGGTSEQVTPGATEEQVAQIEANKNNIELQAEEIKALQGSVESHGESITQMCLPIASGKTVRSGNTITQTLTMEDGSTRTAVVELDDNGNLVKITDNGRDITWDMEGF